MKVNELKKELKGLSTAELVEKENELKPWHSIFCSWSNILGVSAYNDKNNQETHWRYCEI